jgi:copper transporter 1
MDMPMPADSGMAMVFYTSTTTPLFSSFWSPTSPASYAGTCIFLVMLAVAGRFLMAGRHVLEHRWSVRDAQRRAIIVRGRGMGVDTGEGEGKEGLLVGSKEAIGGAGTSAAELPVRPWRLSVDVPRSGYAVLLAGVGYLL